MEQPGDCRVPVSDTTISLEFSPRATPTKSILARDAALEKQLARWLGVPAHGGEAGELINSSPFAPDLCNPAIFRG
jgi:hypothetical protein